MKKTAFTLAELLITMAILGVIAVIILSQTRNLIPNESMTMFKKAYSVTSQITSSMVDDDDLYPDKTDDGEIWVTGFKNTDGTTYKTEERSGNTKFCFLFSEMLNLQTEATCTSTQKSFTDGVVPEGDFTTTDGIVWIMPITAFTSDDNKIYIDINGDAAPNSFTKSTCTPENSDGSSTCHGKEPDRFTIKITPDGKLSVDGNAEKFYLKSENSSAKYYKGPEKK